MSSAICFNLDQSKNLSYGNWLTQILKEVELLPAFSPSPAMFTKDFHKRWICIVDLLITDMKCEDVYHFYYHL